MPNDPSVATDDSGPYLDAADRLERVIDTQIATLDGIDTKAEHVTRLVAILLGVLLTLVSVSARLDSVDAVPPPPPVTLAAVGGVGSLVPAMTGGIVTYLSSRVEMGLHADVGHALSNPGFETTEARHLRRVLGTYGHAVERNRAVIETNSRRFRLTLVCLLVGVSLLSVAASLLVGDIRGAAAWFGLSAAATCIGVVGWYVFTGRYLTLDGQTRANEQG